MTSSFDDAGRTIAAHVRTNDPWRRCAPRRFTGAMFVGHEVKLDISFPSARAKLERLTRDGLLISASDDAYAEEITGLMRVGPAGFSRLVRVQFRDLSERANTAGFALRWEVTGPGGALFPVLDADVELIQAVPQSTWLTIAGTYRPPLGALGEALDRAILHRVATATIRGFLSRIATGITSEPEPGEVSGGVPNAGMGPASAAP